MIRTVCNIGFSAVLGYLLLPTIAVAATEAIAGVLNVADFGAKPDDGKDGTPAVQAALAAAGKAQTPVKLRFGAGQYDFFKQTAAKAHYPVTAIQSERAVIMRKMTFSAFTPHTITSPQA